MRDTFIKQNDYFDRAIQENRNLFQNSLERLKNNKIKNENIQHAKHLISFDAIQILISMYSRGDSMNELKEEFSKVLKYMEDGWDDSVVKFKMGKAQVILDQYWLNDYCYMIWMLSLAILLKVSFDEIAILKKLIEQGKISDELILFLLGNLVNHKYSNLSKTTYKPFHAIITKQGFDNIDSKHIKKYLDNWYKNTKLLTWHNYLNSVENGNFSYFGYWSFESAAIVAIMDLDDSSFKDNPNYPKDLVDYYRANI
ncbi:MAG: DUF1911 domain-containing protein [Saprospiraceae bacterium]